jgi:predicted nucleic acid-binding protein
MILLDTNVVSEVMRVAPDARVVEWMNSHPLQTLYLSAINVAELRSGVALMPVGKRRSTMHQDLEERTLPIFDGRVLPFDMACTTIYAQLTAKFRTSGTPVETADTCIAAVALANGLSVATRDTLPFRAAGLKVINPWQTRPA